MRRGFTLVEMLCVIAIIALLAALVWPSLRAVRSRAREVSCLTAVHQMGVAERLYSDDYDGWLPPGAYNSQVAGARAWDTSWHDLLLPAVRGGVGAFVCPEETADKGLRWSYGASPWLLRYEAGFPSFQVGPGDKVWLAEHATNDWCSFPREVWDPPEHPYLTARHRGRLVALYLDGHARSVPPEALAGQPELWQP